MGDRYTITLTAEALASRFNIDVPDHYKARYNAAPTQLLPVITTGSKGLSMFYWGQIPGRSKNRSIGARLLYAPAESMGDKPSAQSALTQRRCLVPGDSFYAWRQVSKKGRIAHRFVFENNKAVAFAGIWEEFEDDNEEVVHTFKLLTTVAPGNINQITTRIPLILNVKDEAIWQDPTAGIDELLALLSTAPPNNISHYTVSPRIDDPKADGPELIAPFAPADQFGNFSLFD